MSAIRPLECWKLVHPSWWLQVGLDALCGLSKSCWDGIEIETGSVIDRPRSGRPRITTSREDRWITLKHLRDHHQNAVDTAWELCPNRRLHPQTVQNRLREAGLCPYHPAIQTILDLSHQRACLDWTRHHYRMSFAWWRPVVFLTSQNSLCQGRMGEPGVHTTNDMLPVVSWKGTAIGVHSSWFDSTYPQHRLSKRISSIPCEDDDLLQISCSY